MKKIEQNQLMATKKKRLTLDRRGEVREGEEIVELAELRRRTHRHHRHRRRFGFFLRLRVVGRITPMAWTVVGGSGFLRTRFFRNGSSRRFGRTEGGCAGNDVEESSDVRDR